MKVSIYCTVYNHERFLRSALDGFVNQITDFEYEVIVHDDASTDNSAQIIKDYASRYPDIVKPILQKENQRSKGVSILATYILPKLTGEYIAICEGDDYWCDNYKLQRQVDFLDSNPDYVACVHNTLKKDLWHGKEYVMYPQVGDHDIEFIQAIQDGGVCYHTSSLMYKRKYAESKPEFFNKAKSYGDYPLAIYLTLSGKVRFIDIPMSVYRWGTEGSWSKRAATDGKRLLMITQSKIEMLKAVDEYMEYQRTDIIKEAIKHHEYVEMELSGRYYEMKHGEYKQIYRRETPYRKIKIFIKHHFGKYYEFVRAKYYGKKNI